MNRLLIGLPRAGKSYSAVEIILAALRQARVVVTNLALRQDVLIGEDLPGVLVLLSHDDMMSGDFFYKYPGALFVIDEARRFMPAGSQQKDLKDGWDKLLSEHGHFEDWRGRSSEVVLISQCASQLPKCVRTLIDQTCVYEKLNKVGFARHFRKRLYTGAQQLGELRACDLLDTSRGSYKKEIYRFYHTHSQKRSSMFGPSETGDHGSASIFRGSGFRGVALGVVLAIGAFVGLVHYWFPGSKSGAVISGGASALPLSQSAEFGAGGRGEVRAPTPAPNVASVPVVSSRSVVDQLSGYWIFGDQCGAVDVAGHRVPFSDCAALRSARTVAAQPPIGRPAKVPVSFGAMGAPALVDGVSSLAKR